MRVLFLLPGPMPPPLEVKRDRFAALSAELSGEVLLPVWWRTGAELREKLGASTENGHRAGAFTYHLQRNFRFPKPLRKLAAATFFLREGERLMKGHRYDAVICYGAGVPGLCARWLTARHGARLIVEIPGVPHRAFSFGEGGHQLRMLRQRVADLLLTTVLKGAAHVRLLYPGQLDAYPQFRTLPRSVFHEFVPLDAVRARSTQESTPPFVLFLGYPWGLKGVDVLISAFQSITEHFPEVSLKVVGHCTNRAPFEALRRGNPRIELLRGVSQSEAYDLIARCAALVLPSRTESMGRVLLEAMAMGKPVVASAVDGIPHYVRDGVDGLLFPSEDASALARCLSHILDDAELRRRLGEAGRKRVSEQFSEKQYLEHFTAMVRLEPRYGHAPRALPFMKR